MSSIKKLQLGCWTITRGNKEENIPLYRITTIPKNKYSQVYKDAESEMRKDK